MKIIYLNDNWIIIIEIKVLFSRYVMEWWIKKHERQISRKKREQIQNSKTIKD